MRGQLRSLEIQPRGEQGLSLPLAHFGNITTFVLGPNGSGKTPLLRAVAYALGNPTPLADEVQAQCSKVMLGIGDGNAVAVIGRAVRGTFEVECADGARMLRFSQEAAFSDWTLDRLSLPPRMFASKNGSEPVQGYTSVLLPVIFVDQDFGWMDLYPSPKTHDFIKDQREEVLRWVLGVAPKRPPVDKRKFEDAKVQLGGTKDQIAFKRRAMEALVREIGADAQPKAREALAARRDRLLAELASANSVLETIAKAGTQFDAQVRDSCALRDGLQLRLMTSARRRAEILRVRDELSSEVEILETNEIAAEAFRTLCSNDTCGFFRRPEESYGRRLLYLKDQLKDFETSSVAVEQELAHIGTQLQEAEAAARAALGSKTNALEGTQSEQTVRAIDALTRELSEVNVRLDRIDRIGKERAQLEALINRALKEEEEVRELQPHGGGARPEDARLLDCRALLAKTMLEWLTVLNTQNLPREVHFDDEVRLQIGGRPFSPGTASGSTRTRVILSYHAAVVETSLRLGGNHPRFLILDAPKQQELHARDLANFVAKFYALSKAHGNAMQLVIGATDPAIVPNGCADAIWQPQFGAKAQPRFLARAGEAPHVGR